MEQIKMASLPALMQCIARKMAEKSEELCALDAKLGDGDLGLTMKRGFAHLAEFSQKMRPESTKRFFVQCGMELSSAVPSTMGFLMGQGLVTAGKALASGEVMGGADYCIFLRGFADGIALRGKCRPGDRTILDAMAGAVHSAEECCKVRPAAGLAEVAKAALAGARAGAERTKTMTPKFGKAAVHRADAYGIVDQGALAAVYLMEAICTFAESAECGEAEY